MTSVSTNSHVADVCCIHYSSSASYNSLSSQKQKKNNFHLQCSNILLPPQISNYIYNEHFQKLSSEEVQEGKKSAFSSKKQGISVLGMESTSQVLLSRAKLQLLIQPGLCSHHNWILYSSMHYATNCSEQCSPSHLP